MKDGTNVVFLSLGGNIGQRLNNLVSAKQLIEQSCGSIIQSSAIYETAPWGTDSKNPYLNQVIKIRTKHNAVSLLSLIRKIERQLGRIRGNDRNADRTMDIDILFFGDEILQSKNLEVPHPRLHLRNFILKPLSEIAPKLRHPVLKKTIHQLLQQSPDTSKVAKYKVSQALRHICIEGNIGVGKTTLAKALAKKMHAELITEEFNDNALLPLFYKDPKKFALPLEYSFLINRFDQVSKSSKTKRLRISDFAFSKSLWFAKVNLRPAEFTNFKQHFVAMDASLPPCDLYIFLNTSPSNLLANIGKRKRTYEKNIKKPYLTRVSRSYAAGINELQGLQLHLFVENYDSGTTSRLLRDIQLFIKENFG